MIECVEQEMRMLDQSRKTQFPKRSLHLSHAHDDYGGHRPMKYDASVNPNCGKLPRDMPLSLCNCRSSQ